MDVVFNHTAEGNEMGPTISFRGFENRVYYMIAPKVHRPYVHTLGWLGPGRIHDKTSVDIQMMDYVTYYYWSNNLGFYSVIRNLCIKICG